MIHQELTHTSVLAAAVAHATAMDWARTGLLAAGALTVLLCAAVIAEGAARSLHVARGLRHDPDILLKPRPESSVLQSAGSVIGAILVLLAVFGLAVPVEWQPGGYRPAALGHGLLALAGGAALFTLVWRRWSLVRGELAMGLITLGVCLLATVFVPSDPRELQARYPMMFNAILIALAGMSWLWGWLSGIWRQQVDDGTAWTTAGRLVDPAKDFEFQVAVVGVIVALLMAVWPRLGTVGVGDDSLGRMLFGVGGHLLLILALLAGGRRTGRTRYGRTAAVTVLSLLLFIGVRAI
jgi:hypothetical protein